MTSALRRLTRRQAKDQLMDADSDADSHASSTKGVMETPFASRPLTPANHSDLSNTPPPGRSSIRRVSPSAESIKRYKMRAPVAVGPAVATSDSKSIYGIEREAASSDDLYQAPNAMDAGLRERESPDSFSDEGFDHVSIAEAKDAGKQRTNDLETAPVEVSMRSHKLEGGSSEQSSERSRVTRSQSRRKERADSAAAGLISDSTDTGKQIISKTRATAGYDAPGDQQLRKSSDKSRPLVMRKSEQKSPSTSLHTSANSPSRLPNEESPDASSTHSQRFESVSPPGDLRPAADDPGPAKEPTSSPPPSTASKLRELVSRRYVRGDIMSPVVLLPPRYDPTSPPSHQFCSTLPATSRPKVPWGWMRRWTCCRCKGQTIVEQECCAKIDCGHKRCRINCKLI
ncbi:hypothetical protein KC360_g2434 [Hortaea werneckii]|nr:hypothetical protein KC325_g2778 [Hortaea werneckii]KAI6996581.1 hypothetical protein KC359_g3430 [Hortaea werneckii]KAI7149549.1 hypothetical protein KC344_g904 [Hortaea werneckii]KAI7177321.1 hypothetical protein KC360_g2434 [Hortaea werneckii]